jgi:hypothetical protein
MLVNEVLVGKDNMLFLSAGKHGILEYFGGNKVVAKISQRNFFLNLKRRKDYCTKKNIQYSNIIFPDKIFINQAYHDKAVKSLYHTQYRQSHYARKDAYNIYLGDSLETKENIFFRTDTHFSLHGNMETIKIILKSHFPEKFEAYSQYILGNTAIKEAYIGDLGKKLEPNISEKTRVYKSKKANLLIEDNGLATGNDGSIYLYKNDKALSDETLLIFGDSFFRALLPHLAFFYKRIFFCRTRFFHKEVLELVNPDTVFTGMAERYLSQVHLDQDAPYFFTYPLLKNKIQAPTAHFSVLFREFCSKKERI